MHNVYICNYTSVHPEFQRWKEMQNWSFFRRCHWVLYIYIYMWSKVLTHEMYLNICDCNHYILYIKTQHWISCYTLENEHLVISPPPQKKVNSSCPPREGVTRTGDPRGRRPAIAAGFATAEGFEQKPAWISWEKPHKKNNGGKYHVVISNHYELNVMYIIYWYIFEN